MLNKRKNLAKYKNRSTRKSGFLTKPKKTIKKKIHKRKTYKRKTYKREFHNHKINISKTSKRKNHKGGFGRGANPFIGKPWIIDNDANHFAYNPYGQAVGGVDPYFGNTVPAPQHTYGAWASLNQNGGVGFTDLYRTTVDGIINYAPGLGRVWGGIPPKQSSSPTVQPINNM